MECIGIVGNTNMAALRLHLHDVMSNPVLDYRSVVVTVYMRSYDITGFKPGVLHLDESYLKILKCE